MDLNTIQLLAGEYWSYVFAIIGIASVVSTIVPAPKETSGQVYKVLYNILQWCAANIGKAKNATSIESEKKTEDVTKS